jgi:hypothetical protein
MHTDIPLKRLTLLRAADLLPLFGLPYAELLGVDSLELPSTATRLDNILRVRSPGGQTYLHVVEWQGYHDLGVLWRYAGYLAWVGQRSPGEVVVGTLVYLIPEADVGDGLAQVIDGETVSEWPVHCVRLWEQDAAAALASGSPGLAVLSPLMRGADLRLVEGAAELVLRAAPRPEQPDLLSILGVFAEPMMEPAEYMRMIGRERLMESRLIEYLTAEKVAQAVAETNQQHEAERQQHEAERQQHEAEWKAERQRYEAELAARDARAHRERAVEAMQLALEEIIIARFPEARAVVLHDLRRVNDPGTLHDLTTVALHAEDVSALEARLRAIIDDGANGLAAAE